MRKPIRPVVKEFKRRSSQIQVPRGPVMRGDEPQPDVEWPSFDEELPVVQVREDLQQEEQPPMPDHVPYDDLEIPTFLRRTVEETPAPSEAVSAQGESQPINEAPAEADPVVEEAIEETIEVVAASAEEPITEEPIAEAPVETEIVEEPVEVLAETIEAAATDVQVEPEPEPTPVPEAVVELPEVSSLAEEAPAVVEEAMVATTFVEAAVEEIVEEVIEASEEAPAPSARKTELSPSLRKFLREADDRFAKPEEDEFDLLDPKRLGKTPARPKPSAEGIVTMLRSRAYSRWHYERALTTNAPILRPGERWKARLSPHAR